MDYDRAFTIEVVGQASIFIDAPAPSRLRFAVSCEDPFYGFEDRVIPLGRLLRKLGITAEDCRSAIERAGEDDCET
jgi:hypothetical protein